MKSYKPKYEVGDIFKWEEPFTSNLTAVVTGFKGGEYLYTIYEDNRNPRQHPGCNCKVVDKLTYLYQKASKLHKILE